MKKIAFPLLAFILAVSFSAFTSTKSASNNHSLDYDYWYTVNTSGEISGILHDDFPADKAYIQGQFNPCPDQTSTPCAFGSDQVLENGTPIPETPSVDAVIRRS